MKIIGFLLLMLLITLNIAKAGDEIISENFSAPTPFGMWLNHYTLSQLNEDYTSSFLGVYAPTNGDMYVIDTSHMKQPGLTRLTVVFNTRNVLQAVIVEYDKIYAKQVQAKLKRKHTLVKEETKKNGDTFIQFKASDVTIVVETLNSSFKTKVYYKTLAFMNPPQEPEEKPFTNDIE